MYLEHDEVVVVPPRYRLFDCMRVRVCLMPEDEGATPEEMLKENSSWQVKISIGMIPHDNHVEVRTRAFQLKEIPHRQEAIRYWHRVHASAPTVRLGRSVLLYLKHLSGVRVEFPLIDDEVRNFIVHLGAFQVAGQLPEEFVMSIYFGETSRLED